MSTKSTIKYGDDFHFYNECFEDDKVYLELDKASWDADSTGRITVGIPIAIWEFIKDTPSTEFKYAHMSDSDLEKDVTNYVDERIAKYNSEEDTAKAWTNFIGCIPYGLASDPRDEQISRGIDYYTCIREKELKTVNKIKSYKRKNKH